nr:PREDICTED: V-set domain-containing T-cell activation inhibitor 1-like [Latimeria chalumnae]|eukprot:XP_014354095.1 PREDICTED: V-set domain-containing T-cell activation inhibitor 1-like [Latimeria chalumnae]
MDCLFKIIFCLHFSVVLGVSTVTILNPYMRAIAGEDVILQCEFRADRKIVNNNEFRVDWHHETDRDRQVCSYSKGKEQFQNQDAQFSGRVQLFPEEFQNGSASLKLLRVSESDTGRYRCAVVGDDGDDSATAELEVFEPVEVNTGGILVIKSTNQMGNHLLLQFEANSKDHIKDLLHYNLGTKFTDECRISVTEYPSSVQIRLKDVTREDEGVYWVKAVRGQLHTILQRISVSVIGKFTPISLRSLHS